MQEEDINNWFADKKEVLFTDYIKKTDALLAKEQDTEGKSEKEIKKNMEEVKALMHTYEKKFVANSISLRAKYESRVQGARNMEKAKAETKAKLKKFFAPVVFVFKKSVEGIKKGFAAFMVKKKEFDNNMFLKKEERKRKKELKKFQRFSKLKPYRLFYTQHIWPILHYLNTPNRVLKKRAIKFYAKAKDKTKKGTKKAIENIVKAFKWLIEKIKLVIGKIVEFVKKIIEKLNKIVQFFKKLVEIIKIKYGPKEEEKKD
jgi:methyl-accepting chemotaxis protein